MQLLSENYDSVSDKLRSFKCIYADQSCPERADFEMLIEDIMTSMQIREDLPAKV